MIVNLMSKESYRKFHYDKKEITKVREHLRKYPYSVEELESYYHSLYSAYRTILASKPDLVVVPLRGAEPLAKAVRLFATLERKSSQLPSFVYPRLGEQTIEEGTVVDRFSMAKAKTISDRDRKRECSRVVDKAIKERKKRNGRRTDPIILVLDEVVQGGSITKTIGLLREAAATKGKSIITTAIAVSDSGREKSAEYRHLVSLGIIKEYPVKRLFTVDSPTFLRPLIAQRSFLGWKTIPKIGVSKEALTANLDLQERLQQQHAGKKNLAHRLLFKKRPLIR